MNEKEFEELVKRAQKGDAHAFGAAYGVFAADAYRFALFYMKNTHDAEDAVQDACLKAWRRLPSLKKTESFVVLQNSLEYLQKLAFRIEARRGARRDTRNGVGGRKHRA